MVTYMCSMPPAVQKQVSEALSIISVSDFPAKWPEVRSRALEDRRWGGGDCRDAPQPAPLTTAR